MLSPLFRLAIREPQLLVDHLEAYSGLVASELTAATTLWKRQLQLRLLGHACLTVAAVFIGVAIMLWAVVPLSTMTAPWLLLAVPLLPALVGFFVLFAASSVPRTEAFTILRQQWSTDVAMLHEAGQS